MRTFIGVVLFSGLFCGTVFCDKQCDDVLKTVTVKYVDSYGSSDVTVCSEFTLVSCGGKYSPSLLEKRPTIYYDVKGKCQYLTFVFFGQNPDTESEKLLWVTYNIKAQDLKNGFTGQSGNERIIYSPPKNSAGVSEHFVFIYCQEGEIDTLDCPLNDHFDAKNFADRNKLQEVVASTNFQVTADGEIMDKSKIKKEGKCSRQ